MDGTAMTIDEVYQEIGEFGRYQVFCFLYYGGIWVAVAGSILTPVFIATSEPEWACASPAGGMAPAAGALGPCANLTFCEAHEAGLARVLYPERSINAEFGWVCDREGMASLTTSAFFLGMGIGATLFGSLADRLGRRRVFVWALLLSLVCALGTAAALGGTMFTLLRFLSGLACGGVSLVAFIYGNEFMGPSYRAFYSAYSAVLFVVGELLLDAVAYLIPDWRTLLFAMSLTYAPFLLGLRSTPESPKYLLSNGKAAQAKAVLKAIALTNKKPFPTTSLRGDDQKNKAKDNHALLQLLRDGQLRRRLLVSMAAWFTCSMVFYGLSLSSGSIGGNVFMNFALSALAEVPANTAASPVMNMARFGRRKTLALALIISGLLCLSFALLAGAPQGLRVTVSSLGKLFVTAAFAVVYVYSGELFPTALRSSAMGLCSLMSRIGGILAPAIVLLGGIAEAIPFLVFGATGVSFGLLSLTLPETLPAAVAAAGGPGAGTGAYEQVRLEVIRGPLLDENGPAGLEDQEGESLI